IPQGYPYLPFLSFLPFPLRTGNGSGDPSCHLQNAHVWSPNWGGKGGKGGKSLPGLLPATGVPAFSRSAASLLMLVAGEAVLEQQPQSATDALGGLVIADTATHVATCHPT